MKCGYIFAICALFVILEAAPSITDPYVADMKQRYQMGLECLNEVKLDQEVVERAQKNLQNLPTDRKYKEFLACSYKKQGFQTDGGKMLFENLYDFLSRFYKRQDLKTLDSCQKVTGADNAEIAFNTLKCILAGLEQLETQ